MSLGLEMWVRVRYKVIATFLPFKKAIPFDHYHFLEAMPDYATFIVLVYI